MSFDPRQSDADLERWKRIKTRWERERRISTVDVEWLLDKAHASIPPWAGIEIPDELKKVFGWQ